VVARLRADQAAGGRVHAWVVAVLLHVPSLAWAAQPPVGPTVRPTRGEVLIEADTPAGPVEGPDRKLHGEARLGLGFGWVREDPIAAIAPSVLFDLRDLAGLQFGLGAAFRLRLVDREPADEGVLRRQDWDEVGDYLAILQRLEYAEQLAFGQTGQVDVDVRAGTLGRVQLGHASLVRGFHNSLDIDRKRTGVDLVARIQGDLLEQPAALDVGVVMTDLSGLQILGTRLGAEWAGAGIGFSAVGDPTAPHGIARDAGDAEAFAVGRGRRLQHEGRRGVAALGVDISYRASDQWNYVVVPYLDLAALPGLGRGLHLGIDGEVTLGRRRRVRLGAVAEMTVGSDGYDPAYFDVFYLFQRWQVPFVGSASDRPESLGLEALPKQAFVQQHDLRGVGGYGAVRFAHADGAFAETGYQFRPGPLGHTWTTRVGVDLRQVELSVLYAHRGDRHGFEPTARGTVTQAEVRVPVLRYLDVQAQAGWLFAIRPDTSDAIMPSSDVAIVAGAGQFLLGAAGRVPW
jgi:hypothetical protein